MIVHFTRLEIEKAWRWKGREAACYRSVVSETVGDIRLELYSVWLSVLDSQKREPGLGYRCTEMLT